MAHCVFCRSQSTANFEARLYENDPNHRFDIVFGTIQPGSDQLYVSGVQGPNNAFTQDFCDGPPAAGSRTYTCPRGWNTDTYTHCYSDGNSYINGPTDAYAEVCANPKTPSHTSAETVADSAKANIVAVGDSLAVD